ncbi:tRNA-binding protein [soil metagenome]
MRTTKQQSLIFETLWHKFEIKKMISWNDFEKIEIRTGTITDVQDFPKAKKPAYQLIIDFGPLGIKHSSAQITHHYSKEALLNKQIVAVVNFPPKQIATFFSECLVLGVYDENNNVVLLQPDKTVGNGQQIG